jgi:hypothetical protein
MHDNIGQRSAAPEGTTTPCERIWAITALLLAVITISAGWPLLLRTTAALQIDYNEGWNAYRDQLAAHLVPLYSTPPALEITNYPPLSFHLVGLLSHLTGDVTITGRILSLISLAIVCLVIRSITRQFANSDCPGTCAALLFAVWLEVWMPNRIGVNDPQLLGMAFEMMGFYYFIKHSGSGRGMRTSAVLFSLAVFTKHNLIALPLGAGASLLINREWRLLSRWVTAGLLSVALLFLATEIVDGPYFLAHMMRARAYQLSDALWQSIPYLLVFLPFFGIAAAWVHRNRFSARRRPLALSWLAAHVMAFVFSGGDGTGRNMFFEAIVLDAIIVVIAFRDLFARRGSGSAMVAALLLAVPMLFPLCLLPGRVSASMREWHELPRLQDEFARGVSLLRSPASPILCENLLMCYRAGEPSAFDPFFVLDQIKTGRINECEILDLVESQRLGAVEIGDMDAPEPATRLRFTKPFMQALSRRYKVVLRTPRFTILMPADGPQLPAATGMPCVKAPGIGTATPLGKSLGS